MSSRVIRLCLASRMGFILSSDLHAICKGCLRAEHVGQALTPQQASCPCYKLLSYWEKQQSMAIFAPGKGRFQLSESYPLNKALKFFDVRQDLYVSISNEDSICSFTLPIQAGALEPELPVAGAPSGMSATTSLPVISSLVHALPDIIQKAANTRDLIVLEPLAPCFQMTW